MQTANAKHKLNMKLKGQRCIDHEKTSTYLSMTLVTYIPLPLEEDCSKDQHSKQPAEQTYWLDLGVIVRSIAAICSRVYVS